MRLLYRPFGVLFGTIAAVTAAMLWRRLWRVVAHEDKPPRATDRDRSWRQIVIASAVRGAIFGVVRAVIKRSGATAFANVTGTWPGREGPNRA
jgi:hypothetical protein